MPDAPPWDAIILDDERLARQELRRLLEAHPQIRVVGEAESVARAASLAKVLDADLVFVDVQLAGESGFDLVEQLDPGVRVIFVTAHDQFALRAFEVHALDYLVKPVDPDRLARALGRLTGESPRVPGTTSDEFATGPLHLDDRLFLRMNDRMGFLRVGSIMAALADGDNAHLVLADQRTVHVRRSLRDLEDRLPERHFVRIHRSCIVNLEYVERLEPWSHASFMVFLRGRAEPLQMSRRHAARVRARLGG